MSRCNTFGAVQIEVSSPEKKRVNSLAPARQAVDMGLVVGDIGRSLDFYEGLLGLTRMGESDLPFGRLYRLGFGNSMIKLVDPLTVPSPGPEGLVAATGFRYLTFPITNFDAMCERVRTAGISFVMEPQELLPGVWMAMLPDPDGNTIEFVFRPE